MLKGARSRSAMTNVLTSLKFVFIALEKSLLVAVHSRFHLPSRPEHVNWKKNTKGALLNGRDARNSDLSMEIENRKRGDDESVWCARANGSISLT